MVGTSRQHSSSCTPPTNNTTTRANGGNFHFFPPPQKILISLISMGVTKKEDLFSSLNENFHKLRHTAANFCNFITGPEILKFCGHNQLLNCRFVARNFVTARRLGAAAEGRVCDGAMRRRGNRRQCALAAETTEPAGNIAAKF